MGVGDGSIDLAMIGFRLGKGTVWFPQGMVGLVLWYLSALWGGRSAKMGITGRT